jgi:nucleotide-binding universal stress UspA family protein
MPNGAFLVVIDDTAESRLAMRYAARRAAVLGARLVLLHVVRQAGFMQWGGVQEAIDQEAQAEGEALLKELTIEVEASTGIWPETIVRRGSVPEAVVAVAQVGVRTLVLATAAKGAPGPLVEFFAGEAATRLPCLVTIVPGGLDDAAVDRLSG